jgi:hypothetical protein
LFIFVRPLKYSSLPFNSLCALHTAELLMKNIQ